MSFIHLDTDAGSDDAVALALLLHPTNTNLPLKSISTVHGNVSLQQTLLNIPVILKTLSKPPYPKIYPGSENSIIQFPEFKKVLWEGHGVDGMGGKVEEMIKSLGNIEDVPIEKEYAATAMVRIARENPNQMVIVAIGPLTNIGLAIRLDPQFLHNVKRIVVMGGALLAKGNAGVAAEFNFHSDPEAAHILLTESLKLNMETPKVAIIAWEVCINLGFTYDFFERLTASNSKYSKFLRDIHFALLEFNKKNQQVPEIPDQPTTPLGDTSPVASPVSRPTTPHGPDRQLLHFGNHPEDKLFMPCDAYAVIYALYPHICSSDTWCADLELGGKNTRGTLLIDWYRVQSRASERKNVVIVKDMNREQLRKYFAGVFIEKRKTMD